MVKANWGAYRDVIGDVRHEGPYGDMAVRTRNRAASLRERLCERVTGITGLDLKADARRPFVAGRDIVSSAVIVLDTTDGPAVPFVGDIPRLAQAGRRVA